MCVWCKEGQMAVKTGQRVQLDHGVEVIVTTGGDLDPSSRELGPDDEPLKVGKRYQCTSSGVQVLVVKPGPVTLWCGDEPMAVQEPKKTKAAD
jgi:hypothetical protein